MHTVSLCLFTDRDFIVHALQLFKTRNIELSRALMKAGWIGA